MTGPARRGVGRALPWVALALGVLLVVAVVGGRRGEQGNPLDPDSAAPLGTKGLVEVLRELGARVTVSGELPGRGTGTVLLLSDDLTPERREGVLGWVRQGGTLVVADPGSAVTPVEPVGDTRIGLLDAQIERRCDLAALGHVERVAAPGGVVFEVPAGGGTRACFPRNDGAWLLVQPVGAGSVVRLGGASVLVNAELGEADNAVLLASLLAPSPGTAVQVLRPPLPGGGTAGLGDLVAPRVRLALWQLAVAFVLLALWRARRLGRPVAPSWWSPSATCSSGPGAAARRRGCSPTTCAARWPSGWACPPRPRPTRWPTRPPSAPASRGTGCCEPSPPPPPATRPSSSPSAKPSTPSAGRSPVSARGAVLRVREEIAKAVVGQDGAVSGLVAALLVRGHVLLEGVPGVAKTLLVKTMARSLDLEFKRVQFTPDLMPSDVTGQVIFEQRDGSFRFRQGPVFTNLLLADEINRTPPKTQASLLEAMEERQVSVEGQPHRLPEPFLVVATQNPVEYEGTYPLPEAQLDRFLFKLQVGYPSAEQEQAVLARHDAGMDPHDLSTLGVTAVAGRQDLEAGRKEVAAVPVEPMVQAYIVAIARATRESPSLELGVSPRGTTMLLHASKAWAWLAGKPYVTPDEVKAVAKPTLRHRVELRPEVELEGVTADGVLDGVLASVPVPR
jgi:MoxR-like ATPase